MKLLRYSVCCFFCSCLMLQAEEEKPSIEELLAQAQVAYREGKSKEAIEFATQAVTQFENDPRVWQFRGSLYSALRKHQEAYADFNKLVELKPKSSSAVDRRGSEAFCIGKIKESIQDFDKAIVIAPQLEDGHWKRGISYYYAKQFQKGIKQFEGYQTVDDSDVENAVWRFICMAQAEGFENAQDKILKVGEDRRIPMRQIYDLFAGKSTVEDVLKACKADDPDKQTLEHRLFYAYQYLGLYYEAKGEHKLAQEYTKKAVDHPISHYMWNVADVHYKLRQQEPLHKK